jgi:hypothetical protein
VGFIQTKKGLPSFLALSMKSMVEAVTTSSKVVMLYLIPGPALTTKHWTVLLRRCFLFQLDAVVAETRLLNTERNQTLIDQVASS